MVNHVTSHAAVDADVLAPRQRNELYHIFGLVARGHQLAEISPPLGNAAEPSRPLVCFGETPMVGKLAPLPLRLMLRTSQPTGLATYVFSRVEVENV